MALLGLHVDKIILDEVRTMGMYTALHFNVELKPSTPERVITILRYMLDVKGDKEFVGGAPTRADHALFGDTRWHHMLVSDSYYFEADTHSVLKDYPDGYNYGLSITCNFKNYDDELALFLDWIGPHVKADPGDWLGYHMYENDDAPTLIFYQGTS